MRRYVIIREPTEKKFVRGKLVAHCSSHNALLYEESSMVRQPPYRRDHHLYRDVCIGSRWSSVTGYMQAEHRIYVRTRS